jgi:hypothetical protein
LEILDRYKDDPQCLIKKRLLPVLSNQKMNTYLKEIADACNITKKMTFHTARHTFATTVTLTNGVPIETVSKMLGHRNLKTTQHYAKILDLKVSDPNPLTPNAFCICFCFFIKNLIRLNLMQCYFDRVFKIFHNALKNANILRISMILAEQSNQTSESPNCICGCKNRNLMKLTLTKAVCY